MWKSRRTRFSVLGQPLPLFSGGHTISCFQFVFFFLTLAVQSKQFNQIYLFPSGEEQAIETGSTLTIDCVSDNYTPHSISNQNITWRIPGNSKKVGIIRTLIENGNYYLNYLRILKDA